MSPSLCVSESLCLRICVSPSLCVSESTCLRVCVSPSLCLRVYVSHRVCVYPNLCASKSLCLRVSESQCLSLRVSNKSQIFFNFPHWEGMWGSPRASVLEPLVRKDASDRGRPGCNASQSPAPPWRGLTCAAGAGSSRPQWTACSSAAARGAGTRWTRPAASSTCCAPVR